MKKSTLKKLKIALSVAVVSLCVSLPFIGKEVKRAEAQPYWAPIVLEEEYVYGTQFVVPTRTLNVNGTEYPAQAIVKKPSKTATTQSSFILNECGEYTICYSAQGYSFEERFVVRALTYSFGKEDSSAEYTTTELYPDEAGLLVQLARGDTMRFSNLIDVNDLTGLNSLLEFYVIPSELGQRDFSKLIITLTDSRDPSVYVKMQAYSGGGDDSKSYTYLSVAANEQPFTGYMYSGSTAVRQVSNNFGTIIGHSFTGQKIYAGQVYPATSCVKWYFDYEKLSVYANGNTDYLNYPVAKLSSVDCYDTPWFGFPSGYATLSITAENFEGIGANVLILKALGVDLTAENKLIDDVAPVITLKEDVESLPDAVAGKYYQVPNAVAEDLYSGTCEVDTKVYYNYNTTYPITIDVKDGKFETLRKGTYTIVYTASDVYGNTATYHLPITTTDTAQEIEISLVSDKQTEAYMGELVEVPKTSITGGQGKVNVSITATAPNGDKIPVSDTVRMAQEGVYTITYTATDYVGITQTYSYTITVTRGNAPVLMEEPILSKYYISGATYTLPNVDVRDYSTGVAEKLNAVVEITDANGKKTVDAGHTFVPVVKNNGDNIKISYKAKECVLYEREIYTVLSAPDFNVNTNRYNLNIENYFIQDGLNIDTNQTMSVITANRADASWLFVRELLAEDFEMQWKAVPEKSDFEGLTVTLTDSLDESISVTLTLDNSAINASVTYGGRTYDLRSGYDKTSTSNSFTLTYAQKKIAIGSVKIPITTDDNGEEFVGFPSKRLYVRFAFKGAETGAQYQLEKLNGQTINNAIYDTVAPKLVIESGYGGTASIGEIVTLPKADAQDVLNPNITFSLTVFDPDKNVVTDINGKRLEAVDPNVNYTFKIAKCGQYTVAYNVLDKSSITKAEGNKNNGGSYAINVLDEIAPNITLLQTYKTTAKVGNVLVMPDFTVSDVAVEGEEATVYTYPYDDPSLKGGYDPSEVEITVNRFVYTAAGELIRLQGKQNAIKASFEGVYEFRIQAHDKNGNVSVVTWTVTVSK